MFRHDKDLSDRTNLIVHVCHLLINDVRTLTVVSPNTIIQYSFPSAFMLIGLSIQLYTNYSIWLTVSIIH